MSDRANIKVSREFYENHNERRKELGLSWEGYIDSQSPNITVPPVQLDATEYSNIADEIEERLR